MWSCLQDPMLSFFDTVLACDRQTHDDSIYCVNIASCSKNGSHDVTKQFSGTAYRPRAGTCYDQPVHQIWSLYVHPLLRYKRQWKCRNCGDLGLGVTQGHRQCHHLIERNIFDFNRNYASTHTHTHTQTHTHNHFTALLDFVRDYLGESAPER